LRDNICIAVFAQVFHRFLDLSVFNQFVYFADLF
jgi:hypothetical protein